MSSMIGGRSGNRGSCAQSCRQPYSLIDIDTGLTEKHDGGKYLLSPKDLRALEEIPALIEAGGVNSFKIEGRMKRPEYAAVVVRAYREVLDAALEGKSFDLKKWNKDTADIFTRGFTKGYLLGDSTPDRMNQQWPGNSGVEIGTVLKYEKDRKRMLISISDELHVGDEIQIRRGNDSVGARVEFIEKGRARVKTAETGQEIIMNMQYPVKPGEVIYRTVNDALIKSARQTYARQVQRVAVEMSLDIKANQPMNLNIIDEDGNKVSVTGGDMPEAAMNRPLDKDRVEKQIMKLGDSPYYSKALNIGLDDGLALPMKSINALRRDAIEALDEMRSIKYKHRAEVAPIETSEISELQSNVQSDSQSESDNDDVFTHPKFHIEVRNREQLKTAIDVGVDAIMVSTFEMIDIAIEETEEIYCPIIFAPGRIVRDFEYEKLDENLEKKLSHCQGFGLALMA